MWRENEKFFLWDYFSSYAIKMTMCMFIFEMMRVWIYVTSDNLEENKLKLRKKSIFMYTVYGVHTFCIVIILMYNYVYLVGMDESIKTGWLGLLY